MLDVQVFCNPRSGLELAGMKLAVGNGERKRHETIKRVTEDIEGLRLNTAISAMMELVNAFYEVVDLDPPRAPSPEPRADLRKEFETLVLLLSPFAPHLCEELWERLGHRDSLAGAKWPQFDPAALAASEIQMVVQVNGKVRARLTVPAEATEAQLRAAALADPQVSKFVNGQPIKQFIVVPKRLVSIVI